MAWQKLQISVPDLGTGNLSDIIKKIKEYLEAIVSVLETILNTIVAVTDPLSTLIKALIETLKKIVEGFLEDAGGYVIYLPIRKRLATDFLGLGDITPSWADKMGIFEDPGSELSWDNPELNSFIAQSNRYNGGNGGFFRSFMESLYDEGDTNRPQFLDWDDYVGGYVLVMGTDFDPLGFLDDIWRLFGIFNGPDTLPKVPRPTGLQVRPLCSISSGVFDALLTWDPPQVPVYQLDDLGGVILYPTRYAVIRGKNNCGFLSAQNVIDLMGKRQLAVGDTFENNSIEVLLEDNYDISKTTYLDKDIPATEGDSFYYAIAWQLKAYNANASTTTSEGTLMDYWNISNVVRTIPFPILPASTPPDWYRTPSIASIFPEFAKILRRLVAQLEAYAHKLTSGLDLITDYVNFLKKEIDRYEALINYFLDELARLQAKFELPTAGVYVRSFIGQGGNNFLITDLAQSLLKGYPNAPPFHKGDEFVTGAIIMTGAPGIASGKAAVEAFIASLSWIFGGGGSDSDEMTEMLSQLGEAVAAEEDSYFGPTMRIEVPPETIQFDTSFVPTNCNPSASVEATFGPNMRLLNANA